MRLQKDKYTARYVARSEQLVRRGGCAALSAQLQKESRQSQQSGASTRRGGARNGSARLGAGARSFGTTACDCQIGDWLERCAGDATVALASMTWSKGHNYHAGFGTQLPVSPRTRNRPESG